MDADALTQRRAEQTIGIGVAQVCLGEEGQLVQIVDSADIVRSDALFFHFFAIVGNIIPDVLNLFNEALVLPSQNLLTGSGFNFWLIVMGHREHFFLKSE